QYLYIYGRADRESSATCIKAKHNKATVKSANYILDDSKPVNFVKVNDKTAKATVSLKKEETDFYPFQKGDNASVFKTKTYRLKLKKDAGWVVTGG
ncbi:MAG TPA: hypothetical protein DIT07_10295, partial [Sphingobacteriaceae bacterium]|nr:hypothetical protein [Sphingobacteriaceae bacterium]